MRTVKKPEVRKQEILIGAMTVFSRQGYEKTTISNIAQALGISQGLCYRYFASKEEIYDAVIDLYAAAIAEKNLKNRPSCLSLQEWVAQIPERIRVMAEAEQEDARLYAVFHNPENSRMHRELYLKIGEKLLPVITEVLEQARDQGELPIVNCRETAAFGLYGEIDLLMAQGTDCGDAIRENWRRLLGMPD